MTQTHLIVPVGDGAGDTKSDESGMFTFSGAIADLKASRVCCLSGPFSFDFSSTNDWKTSFMFVLGNRKVHLKMYTMSKHPVVCHPLSGSRSRLGPM